jgi:hypothetical protein
MHTIAQRNKQYSACQKTLATDALRICLRSNTPAACRALGCGTSYPAQEPGYWWQACSLRRCQLDQQMRCSVQRDAFVAQFQMPAHSALERDWGSAIVERTGCLQSRLACREISNSAHIPHPSRACSIQAALSARWREHPLHAGLQCKLSRRVFKQRIAPLRLPSSELLKEQGGSRRSLSAKLRSGRHWGTGSCDFLPSSTTEGTSRAWRVGCIRVRGSIVCTTRNSDFLDSPSLIKDGILARWTARWLRSDAALRTPHKLLYHDLSLQLLW